MSVRDWEKFRESTWDWAVLRGCFGNTKIEPTDIDGAVERNGCFLWFETKLPNAPIPYGQELFYSRLVQDRRHAVIFVWGHPGAPHKLELWHGTKKRQYLNADMDSLREVVTNWFKYADANPNGIGH